MQRWINRDPIVDDNPVIPAAASVALRVGDGAGSGALVSLPGDNAKQANVYIFVHNEPLSSQDPIGLDDIGPGAQPTPCRNHCFDVPPLPSSSPECNRYGDRTYHGIRLKCFCQCAGDSDWSKAVRACLRCMDNAGYPTSEAHEKCYKDADHKYSRPTVRLGICALRCQ